MVFKELFLILPFSEIERMEYFFNFKHILDMVKVKIAKVSKSFDPGTPKPPAVNNESLRDSCNPTFKSVAWALILAEECLRMTRNSEY